jgi:hypothetical protein
MSRHRGDHRCGRIVTATAYPRHRPARHPRPFKRRTGSPERRTGMATSSALPLACSRAFAPFTASRNSMEGVVHARRACERRSAPVRAPPRPPVPSSHQLREDIACPRSRPDPPAVVAETGPSQHNSEPRSARLARGAGLPHRRPAAYRDRSARYRRKSRTAPALLVARIKSGWCSLASLQALRISRQSRTLQPGV